MQAELRQPLEYVYIYEQRFALREAIVEWKEERQWATNLCWVNR